MNILRVIPRFAMLLPGTLCGCITHWVAQKEPAPAAIAKAPEGQLRITRRDGSHVVLEQAVIEGGSLIGHLDGTESSTGPAMRATLPLADVTTISRREIDVGASVAVGLAASATTLFVLLTSTGGRSWGD